MLFRSVAAGLAILGKDYATYDKPFADSCLMVAKQMYDFAKNLANGKSTYDNGTKTFVHNKKAAGWSSSAYNGNNEFFDDMALAAVALLYATGDAQYLNDAAENQTFTTTPAQQFGMTGAGLFNGGWFVTNDKGFLKNGKNTSWANAYSYALYAFFKLILKDSETAAKYGIDETKRLGYIEDVVANMIYNLGDVGTTGTASITLPSGSIGWKQTTIHYDPIWYSMVTDQTWIYNRYQAGHIFEVPAYADGAGNIEAQGLKLPIMGTPDWKADEMHQLGINQLNYMLGENPWDVSFILGVGDKNDAQPHHRAANPEGKNMPGANYKYTPPYRSALRRRNPGRHEFLGPEHDELGRLSFVRNLYRRSGDSRQRMHGRLQDRGQNPRADSRCGNPSREHGFRDRVHQAEPPEHGCRLLRNLRKRNDHGSDPGQQCRRDNP